MTCRRLRGTVAVAIAAAAVAVYMSGIYVSPRFERPVLYRCIHACMALITSISKMAANVGIGSSEAANMRLIFALMQPTSGADPLVDEWHERIGNVRVKVFAPVGHRLKFESESNNNTRLPIMLYFHGGGFAYGVLEAYDDYLREFVKQLDMLVVSVDYRLAPEHPYPAGVDDCHSVAEYFLDNTDGDQRRLGADVTRMVLAGDSAGGNAVVVVNQRLAKNNNNTRRPKLQVLIYPWLQMADLTLPSHRFYDPQRTLIPNMYPNFIAWYVGLVNMSEDEVAGVMSDNSHWAVGIAGIDDLASRLDVDRLVGDEFKLGREYYKDKTAAKESNERPMASAAAWRKVFSADVSPLLADDGQLVAMPATYMVVLEWDGVKDEGLMFASRLRHVGVPVELAFYEDAFHGCATAAPWLDVSRQMHAGIIDFLKRNI